MGIVLTFGGVAIVFFLWIDSEVKRDRRENPRKFSCTLGDNNKILNHAGKVIGTVDDLPRLRKEFYERYGYPENYKEEDEEETSQGSGAIGFIVAIAVVVGILITMSMFESFI